MKKIRVDLQSKLDKNERKFNQPDSDQQQSDSLDDQLRTTIMNADDYLLSAALTTPLDNQFTTADLNELNTNLQLNAAELNLNALNNIINHHQTYDVNNLILDNHQSFNQQTAAAVAANLTQQNSLPGLSSDGGQIYSEFDSMLTNQLSQQQSDSNLNQFRDANKRLHQENSIELLLKKRLKLLQSLRRLSNWTKVKNVNKIDKYSRILFPTSFALFNIVYWTFYKL